MWGGHPEVRALSCVVARPIRVFQAAAEPLVVSGSDDCDGEELTISYVVFCFTGISLPCGVV